ncbi:hypothetical protein FYJ51_11560 [Erysipelotrichaceae bacterium Oil+RF-744-GAM-WT-6]|uniref:Uncharacterized protein n=1 Tax=Stecheria intestinalis TaxID=2606630 RepID=A0A7X2NU21_9FIRM|nr:hypothetical protein [Stecheria intestinalis]MSS59529.1 hypothetical protein [Stecheria intestinalis]
MNGMFFKNILVADVQEKTARFVDFKPGLNVITSSDNHVGKSSIVKSLYHTLGAEVNFDARWSKDTKINLVTIDVDGTEYQIARFLKRFAVFKGEELLLLTDSVTKELAPMLGQMFDFSVYLAEKEGNRKVVQAPPVFTFMPYYIDQDKGWSALYNSFEKMDQFSKPERSKSIYFHLGIYTKARIELQAKKNQLKDDIEELKQKENELRVTIKSLSDEVNHLIPAENIDELEKQLRLPKKDIEDLVQRAGRVRNQIQELQTGLQQHEYQLDVISQYQQIKPQIEDETENKKGLHVCPNCGYEFDDELDELVRSNYSQSNEEYLKSQINLIIDNIKKELKTAEDSYVSLMAELKNKEKAYDESQDAYNAYLRYKGLGDTLKKYQLDLAKNHIDQSDKQDEIKEIDKELKKTPDKKEIENDYVSHVKRNIIHFGVWDQAYDKKIKLLSGLQGQGSLTPKIILSQFIGLFQTMDDLKRSIIRFPFVVDSPRNMESSERSSEEILNEIVTIDYLPQIIVATVDYDKFHVCDGGKANKVYLSKQFHVLEKDQYKKHSYTIEGLYDLLRSEDK